MQKKSSNPSPDDDSQQLGLELGGDLQSSAPEPKPEKAKKVAAYKQSRGRLERVAARDWLEAAIAAQNGDDECHRNCTGEITRTAFGVTPRRLYKLVGGTPGDRDTLPVEMQNKLMVHELTIAPQIDSKTIIGESQTDINNQILYVVSTQAQETEQFLKRGNLYQGLVEKYRITEAIATSQSQSEPDPPESAPAEIPEEESPY